MNRAQIDRRIHAELAREGLLGPWVIHTLEKNKRALAWVYPPREEREM